jgi:hypothetical protein
MCGPVWATWAFPMERFCGKLQRAVKGRRYVWASIDNWVLRTAQATHIRFRYNLTVTGACTAHERRAKGYVKRDLCRGGSVPKARS